jgi:lactate 2-monooxygenase
MTESTRPTSFGIQRQMEIYEQGLMGIAPSVPLAYEELEAEAGRKLKPAAFAYVAGGAGAEWTMRANRDAFAQWRIVPRVLSDVQNRDLSITLFDEKLPTPLLLAPVGVLGIVHPEAELAAGRAAVKLGMPFIASTVSSFPLEEIGSAMGSSPHWFQLYWPAHQDLAASFLSRAQRAGFSTLVVTLDTHLLSWRERDLQNAYLPFLHGEGLANYFTDPVFSQLVGGDPRLHPEKSIRLFGQLFSNPALTWENLRWLRSVTKMRIVLKGILHEDDARRAVDHGVDGLIVSNHGGRQLDGARASLDALASIAAAVKERTTLLFDSGIRRGADVFKALVLGAQGVLVGRPYVYGLALQGEGGVQEVMSNLLADFDLTLGLAGCKTARELTSQLLEAARSLP